jgi:AcrR family transcriptional regulator
MAARLPAPRRRRQLLDVALEVFGELGYHQASMDAVAEAAGVTKPVLYQHFGSKRELYLELLDDVGTQLLDAVVEATSRVDQPRVRVEAGFAAYYRYVESHVNAFRILFGGGIDPDEEFTAVMSRVEDTMASTIASLIDADIDPEHRRLLAYGVVGLAETTSRHWVNGGLNIDADRMASRLAELAWAGLRAVHRE